MKKTIPTIVMAMLCLIFTTKAQQIVSLAGKVITSTDSTPLSGATIKIKGEAGVLSDTEGKFTIKTSSPKGLLIISYTGYKTVEIPFNKTDAGPFNIILEEEESTLKEVEVISTGYQTLNREKTAGSFVQITNKELNRSVSTNILDRLKDIVPGMYFENRDPQLNTPVKYPNAKSSGITIRGQSTFNGSKEPLIILDNFPYEGEIKNINPNDIDNITILKDASSASIWGAKSGNGVIIITTKKGKLNQRMKIDFMSTVTLTNKPDLEYSTSFLDAKGYVEVEQYLFDKGFFNSQLNNTTSFPTVSPAVELMSKYKAATTDEQRTIISKQLDALKDNDVRNDYSKYIYQQGINQQICAGFKRRNR